MAKKGKTKVIRRKKNTRKKKKKQRSQKRTWQQRLFFLCVVLFVVTTIFLFFFSSLTEVTNIEVLGTERVDNNEIKKIVKKSLAGNFALYIKKNNYFFADKSDIEQRIMYDQRVKNVVITKKFPHEIIVNIEEYDDIPIWCVGSENGKCFIIDGDIAVREVTLHDDIVTQNEHFVMIDELNNDVVVGDRVITRDHVQKIATLGKELVYVLNAKIEQPYFVVSRGSHEVRFVTDEGWYILVDLTQDVQKTLDTAQLFVQKVELPAPRRELEYVDMRFGEKIFYKMKDGVEQEQENTKKEENNKEDDKKPEIKDPSDKASDKDE